VSGPGTAVDVHDGQVGPSGRRSMASITWIVQRDNVGRRPAAAGPANRQHPSSSISLPMMTETYSAVVRSVAQVGPAHRLVQMDGMQQNVAVDRARGFLEARRRGRVGLSLCACYSLACSAASLSFGLLKSRVPKCSVAICLRPPACRCAGYCKLPATNISGEAGVELRFLRLRQAAGLRAKTKAAAPEELPLCRSDERLEVELSAELHRTCSCVWSTVVRSW